MNQVYRKSMLCYYLSVTIVSVLIFNTDGFECNKRSFGADSYVCVCNSAECDLYDSVTTPEQGKYNLIVTSRDSPGYIESLQRTEEHATAKDSSVIEVDYKSGLQTILGFGGAFTDSTGYNILSLSAHTQDFLLRSYFSPSGNSYNLCRLPIAGTDFSHRPYSYDDVENDVTLANFSLTEEDYKLKIPFIKEAKRLSSEDILLLASPWSPPAWMKDNGQFKGSGGLLREMWEVYAKYIVRFLESYAEEGITVWGITSQNEASGGLQEHQTGGKLKPIASFVDWNQCAWTAEDMMNWIKCCLGPTVKNGKFQDVKIFGHDSVRATLDYYNKEMFSNEEAAGFVDGIGIHWYFDDIISPEILSRTHAAYPTKMLLVTEACEGAVDTPPDQKVILGSWQRAQNYASNILENLNHFVEGWIDWNMALDMSGGPNWADNRVDATIIVNSTADEFYKQPTFYALGHFSRFVKRGSIRLSAHTQNDNIALSAFRDSENVISLILLNKSNSSQRISVKTEDNTYINTILAPKSLSTVRYKSSSKLTIDLNRIEL